MPPHRFSVDQANALLARLRSTIPQLQEVKARHDRFQGQVEEASGRMASNGHLVEKDLNEARQELAKAVAEMKSLIERVQEMGCELKDIDQGLVDFRAEREGREVYLCWKLGEDEVLWWHELDAGFAGRKPLE
jgi:hypothetical protein